MNQIGDDGRKAVIDPKKLRLYRIHSRRTLEEAAQAIGVDKKTLAAWEQGDKVPQGRQLVWLAGLYGRRIDDFMESEWNQEAEK